MASSSSSTPSSQSLLKKYDVFISFRGDDTRFNFTSHLHEALRRNQVETYIDYRLVKGDEVWPSLEKAIQDSILSLVIFSENYASSTWCLKELSKILECSNLVMPVFYRVDPSDVRKQSGSYQKAFEEHELKRINSPQLQMWREALTYAANLAGWHSSSNSNEAELIKEIVKRVEQKLSCNYQNEDYLKDLIGIHKRMRDVESLLERGSNNVQFIGIWGMGGIGKTTLAQALFKKLRSGYEGSSFLANVREKSKKDGIDNLKKKLILELLGDGDPMSSFAMRRLCHKKVLVVLDDVDDHDQLENLAGRHDWFGAGSKILITTRDKRVFGNKVDDNDDIYQLEALNSNEAFQLFSLNAFKTRYGGDPEITELARKMTEYADGNPLALKVLGSLLYGINQEAWKSQLKKLQRLPCREINDILKFSFEGLDNEEKNIFLHIACFFDYYDVEDIKALLDSCGYSTEIGLIRLEDKALLNIHKGRIQMHHLIREMGQQIVREESLNDSKRCNILWICKKNSLILKKNKGSEVAEGIIIDLSEVEEMCLSDEAFRPMPNLKFLDVDHRNFYGHQFENKLKFSSGLEFLPTSLILLRWPRYPSKSLPLTFNVESFIEIIMPDSNFTKLWDGVQNLVNLRNIDLSGSTKLIELPDFSKAIHLKIVHLTLCKKLRSVHLSILGLHSLRRLCLSYCESLTSVTSNTHLKSLSHLNMSKCSRLNKFSVTSEIVDFEFDLNGTAINGELCSSSGHLNKIERLSIEGWDSVTSVHKLIDPLYIRKLNAGWCNKIASNLRSTFDEMRALQVLWLRNCSELVEVPDNISLLSSSLRALDLSESNIETLPASFKHLTSLHVLYLFRCRSLRCLPQLPPSIHELHMDDCISLEILHSPLTTEDGLPNPPSRRFLGFRNCMKLDGESIKAAEARVALDIKGAIHECVRMEYPGERVPEWFLYRTIGSFLTVDLSSIPQPWDGSFVFCAVLSTSPPRRLMGHNKYTRYLAEFCVEFFIDGEYACRTPQSVYLRGSLFSDHVFLWYGPKPSGELERKIEEKKREAQTNTDYHPLLLQFQFSLPHERFEIIKECGVCQHQHLNIKITFNNFNCLQMLKMQRVKIAATTSFCLIFKHWIPLHIKAVVFYL